MYQVLIRKGKVIAEQVPAPVVSLGGVLIRTVCSCISSGTELASLEGSGKSLVRKALEQPEKVRKALRMASEEGVASALEKVRGKLDSPSATGYSLAGIVLSVGAEVTDLKPGDRVAAAGAGQAHHAEFVDVPRSLVVRMPDDLDFQQASLVALGGIAMQGVRRLGPSLGEYVAVIGAGIVGQLAAQMLRLSGARVAVIDLDDKRLQLAKTLGAEKIVNGAAENAVEAIQQWTGGRGTDAVLFCASTGNPSALKQAFSMTRKKGRVVMVGVWGNVLDRSDIYEKEIDFLISTSYGPGRYDENYEQKNLDYPYSYVRWTENRNMEEYLRLAAEKNLDANRLIHAAFPIAQAEKAFAALQDPEKKPVAVVLNYNGAEPATVSSLKSASTSPRTVAGKLVRVGIVGAGGFTSNVHLPNLKKLSSEYKIQAICNRTGHTAQTLAERYGARYATTDYRKILSDSEVDLVLIGTRHASHGPLVLESLRAGKHVFVEKPLCLRREELQSIGDFFKGNSSAEKPLLMTGFNRRFSHYAQEIKKHVSRRQDPLFIHYRMNAGHIPLDHWVHGEEGGGRIVGEACHIVDLFLFLTGSRLRSIHVASLSPKTEFFGARDNRAITFSFADGSLAALEYFAVGSTDYPKEFMEVHFDRKTLVLDDYQSLKGYGIKIKELSSRGREKGHLEELRALHVALTTKDASWPISLDDMLETTEATFQIEESGADIHGQD